MSFPSRLSVLVSGSSSPGVAGSGICFTQTAMFTGHSYPAVIPRTGGADSGPIRAAASKRPPRTPGGTVDAMPLNADVDVLVVGAGPAGAAAGIAAHRQGLDVLVV